VRKRLAGRARSGARVRSGLDVLVERGFDSLRGKRLGVLCHAASVDRSGTHLLDILSSRRDLRVECLLAAEHGMDASLPAGVDVPPSRRKDLLVHSLYGSTRPPWPKILATVDTILVDLQDVGVRVYTYASTMHECIEAAAKYGKQVVVLDRPNPITGVRLSGPVSGVALRHGMTMGELARLFVAEHDLPSSCVSVVALEGWTREMWFDETGLPWVPPSPNMPSLDTAIVYPGFCLFEGTNVSEGRGTFMPFEQVGAPWLDNRAAIERLDRVRPPGCTFQPVVFTPHSIPHAAKSPAYRERVCRGLRICVSDRDTFAPVLTALWTLKVIKELEPGKFRWRRQQFDDLLGTPEVRKAIDAGDSPPTIAGRWQTALPEFEDYRTGFLLY